MVGSLTERDVLKRLVADPDARNLAVSAVMGDPFPEVDGAVALDALLPYLDRGPGAVLVRSETGALVILTRADLINALTM